MNPNNKTEIEFPKEWDKSNPSMVSYYMKCKGYVSSTDDMIKLFDTSLFYHFYCLFLFIFSLVSAYYGIKYRNKIKIIKSNIVLIIFYSFGCIICIINSYFIQSKYSTYPCVAYFYLTGIEDQNLYSIEYVIDSYSLVFIERVCAGLFICAMLIPSYNCSQIVRYLPSDAYALIISCSFHYSQVIGPLLDYYYVNKKANKLELNKNGLIQLLNEEYLFNEFFEYCKQKCCVENAIFHIEYTKLKNLINPSNNKKNKIDMSKSEYCVSKTSKSLNMMGVSENNICDHLSGSSFSDFEIDNKSTKSDPDGSNMKENKRKTVIYYDVHKLINEIFNNFIDDDAKYEINIPGRIKKELKANLTEHNQQFSKGEFNLVDDIFEIENIFDDAYEEVLQDLFLNVYTGFISNRNKIKEDKKIGKKTEKKRISA
ncbi:hypothetical protein PIROE2DRAFT_2475 [Piromyces sp. E2]|nr:hypothetical protein PIROE2DRAFT_2475 [Piromyces sp. E2]|eukprot:OUM69607.1 hypothetical protein PIROE2DRAFT_2475 [Piromyces sp. E2]